MSGEQPRNYTANQQKIIKRYYDNISDIKHERLAELVGELYLAEGKKKEKVWQTTGEVMAPVARPGSHPMPRHVNGSRCAFFMPQLVIVLTAQLAAAT